MKNAKKILVSSVCDEATQANSPSHKTKRNMRGTTLACPVISQVGDIFQNKQTKNS